MSDISKVDGQVWISSPPIIPVFIFAIIATAMLPFIADQVTEARTEPTEESWKDLWPTFLIIGGLLLMMIVVEKLPDKGGGFVG